MMAALWLFSNTLRVEYHGLGLSWRVKHQAAATFVDDYDATRLSAHMTGQDCFEGLDHRHGVAVGRQIVVSKSPHLLQTFAPLLRWAAELDERHFLEEPPQDLDAVAALRALAPRLHERAIVMMVRGDLQIMGC